MLIILLKRLGVERHEGQEDGGDSRGRCGRAAAAADDDGRRRRGRRVAGHRLARAQQHPRGAAVGLDPGAGPRGGGRARLHAARTRARPRRPGRGDDDRFPLRRDLDRPLVRAAARRGPREGLGARADGDGRCQPRRPRARGGAARSAAARAGGRADLRRDPQPSHPAAAAVPAHADGAPELLRARPFAGLGGPGRAPRRLCRDAAPDPRRPPPHRAYPRPVLDRSGA